MRDRFVPPQVQSAFQEQRLRVWTEDRLVLQVLDDVEAVRALFRLPQSGQIRLSIVGSRCWRRSIRLPVGRSRDPRGGELEPLSADADRQSNGQGRGQHSGHGNPPLWPDYVGVSVRCTFRVFSWTPSRL